MKPVLSIVMPYWERYEATKKALSRYSEYYNPDVVEVVLVDDGSPSQPAEGLEQYYEGLKIITLPGKEQAKNPCVPINKGMRAAQGEFVGLSNPEIIHAQPVFDEMLGAIEFENDYVLAPAWCPEMRMWHCHPTLTQAPDLPPGTGFHFLTIMTRKLWGETGGFDEDYRNGQGYDDTDFIRRLMRAGANFKFIDTPVIHPRGGAHAKWAMPSNRPLYLRKWGLDR